MASSLHNVCRAAWLSLAGKDRGNRCRTRSIDAPLTHSREGDVFDQIHRVGAPATPTRRRPVAATERFRPRNPSSLPCLRPDRRSPRGGRSRHPSREADDIPRRSCAASAAHQFYTQPWVATIYPKNESALQSAHLTRVWMAQTGQEVVGFVAADGLDSGRSLGEIHGSARCGLRHKGWGTQ